MTKRTRYDYDIRRGTRRRETDYSGCGVVVVVLLMFSLLAGFCAVLAKQTNAAATMTRQKHDSLTATDTYDGEKIRYYVMVDPDTGLQYVVNDRGGMCPRYDREGKQMGVTIVEQDG